MKTASYIIIALCLIWIVGASSGHVTWRGKVYSWRGPFLSKK